MIAKGGYVIGRGVEEANVILVRLRVSTEWTTEEFCIVVRVLRRFALAVGLHLLLLVVAISAGSCLKLAVLYRQLRTYSSPHRATSYVDQTAAANHTTTPGRV